MALAVASQLLMTTFPVKPSQRQTSRRDSKSSWPSTLPSHSKGARPESASSLNFYQRTCPRLIRPALSIVEAPPSTRPSPEDKDLQRFQSAMDNFILDRAA